MAQIIEERMTIVISRMAADDSSTSGKSAIDMEFIESIQAVAQELAGSGVIVEIKENE